MPEWDVVWELTGVVRIEAASQLDALSIVNAYDGDVVADSQIRDVYAIEAHRVSPET